MRDIQQVLERWGAWAAANHENVCWPPVAAGFKTLIPEKVKSRRQCCDEDGITISNVMAGIRSQHPVAHDLLFEFYIMGKSIAQLSRDHHCSDTHAGKKLQWAEGVFAGYLMGLDIKLEMDREVRIYELDILPGLKAEDSYCVQIET